MEVKIDLDRDEKINILASRLADLLEPDEVVIIECGAYEVAQMVESITINSSDYNLRF